MKKTKPLCIYVACLVEDNFVFTEAFGRTHQEDPYMLYEYKILVVESMEFNLMVYTPYCTM